MNALETFAAARPDVEVDDDVLAAIAADVFNGFPRNDGGSARWRLLAVAAALVALIAGLAVVVGRPTPRLRSTPSRPQSQTEWYRSRCSRTTSRRGARAGRPRSPCPWGRRRARQ